MDAGGTRLWICTIMKELAKGRKSGEEKGWLTLEAVEEHLGLTHE